MRSASIAATLAVAASVALGGCEDKQPAAAEPPATSAMPADSSPAPAAEAKSAEPKPAPGGVKNVPREGELEVDREASTLGWTDKHVGPDDKAHFESYEATLGLKDGKPASLMFTFKAPSLSVEDKPDLERRSKADVLDATNNAKASFVSESISPTSNETKYEVEGKMTFRLTPKPVTFPIVVETKGTSFRVQGEFHLVGANHGTTGKPGVHLDLVFPFPD